MSQRKSNRPRSAGALLAAFFAVGVVASLTLIACSVPDVNRPTAAADTAGKNAATARRRSPASPGTELDRILKRGTLRVVTLRAPSAYYTDQHRERLGPEYALVTAFAKSLGVEPEFVVEDSREQVYSALAAGRADIAAAGLPVTVDRKHDFSFSEALARTRQQVVCRRYGDAARTPDELADVRLEVTDALANLATLWVLENRHEGVQWVAHDGVSQEAMLWKVWKRETDCTLADSHVVALAQRVMPELRTMFDVSEDRPLAWATRRGDHSLIDAVNRWIDGEGSSLVAAVTYEYYGGVEDFDYVDTRILIRRLASRFPRFSDIIEQAGEEHGFDPLLLAALSYQESHWDPHAKSPTGVRGLMMLTRSTASELGVSNRLDPRQVIPAGARYLAMLRESFDGRIAEPDRTYMALAAYNIGRARLHDAQQLAREQGSDPYSWLVLKDVLHNLCELKPASCKGHRYDLGAEAVRYVDRIRFYRDVIAANRRDSFLLAYNGNHNG